MEILSLLDREAEPEEKSAGVRLPTIENFEYSASEARELMQRLFPHRRLVLSQFTFFNQVKIAVATGETFRRGRRCYRLLDLLSVGCVLALKEEGIPYKNIEAVPGMIQKNAQLIFELGPGCRLSGSGEQVGLNLPGRPLQGEEVLESFLDRSEDQLGQNQGIFWSFDLGLLAAQLRSIAEELREVVPGKDAAQLRIVAA